MLKYTWLFGENLGNTSNNNSFYFWKEINEIDDGINKFFVMSKTKENKKTYKKLTKNQKKNIIWKNSIKHWKYYKESDLCFVTLSYKDVQPSKILIKNVNLKTISQIIYLQHGTLAMKKIGYSGKSYGNNMFKFLYYNPKIYEILKQENNFKSYQLVYMPYHPRYKELILKSEKYKKDNPNKGKKSILWFMTWREYFGNNKETDIFINQIKSTLSDYKMIKLLEDEKYELKICLHQFFDKEKINYMTKGLEKCNVKIVTPNEVDIMDEVVKNDILITDYSSLGFDFSVLGKKVILYQPDIKVYSKYREFYFFNKMKENSVTTIKSLLQELVKEDNDINPFFKSMLPDIDINEIKSGKYMIELYNKLANMQKNDITFIGYNFFGKGGTVSATLSLAEGLLEKGYLVKLISLKKHIKNSSFPNGLNVKAFYTTKGKKTKVKRYLFIYKKKTAFKYDPNKKYLIPYAEYALNKKLKTITSHTVVSTRESLHLYLKNAKSELIKNKIYFFHTDYKILRSQFKGLIEKLKEVELEKVAFVSNNSKNNYENKLNYKQYKECKIIENCLDSSKMIDINNIQPIEKKRKYKAVYLLRISKDRINDINNLIGFAEFLKEKRSNNIKIDVYGTGDYVEEFENLIIEKNIDKYVSYQGLTTNISYTLKQYDCVIDFSLNHSFGMTYIEAILNGKMLFAMKNQGSLEVLKELPYMYIESYQDLFEKINKLKDIKLSDLRKNYELIYSKFSRDKITNKFIDYINNNEENRQNEREIKE